MLIYFCQGEKLPNKLLQERLFQRIHLSDTRSENFLFEDEYRLWKLRQHIIKQINQQNFEQAHKLLQEYKGKVCMENCLEQQFCMVMNIYMLPEAKRGKYWKQALKLTVPNIDTKPLSQLMLSETELDLLLEYVRTCHFQHLSKTCDKVISYIQSHISDTCVRAKILPKAVYYQCLVAKRQDIKDYAKLMRNCDEAIECLRDTKRLYYFWENLNYEHHFKKCQQGNSAGKSHRRCQSFFRSG